MIGHLLPISRTADGDAILPALGRRYVVHHMGVNDEGAGTALFELYGAKPVAIAAPITSISIAAPAVIAATAHGLSIGDKVFLAHTDGDIGDGYGVVDAANFTVDTISLTGKAATVAGTKGVIHLAESINKLTNFGDSSLGGSLGVGPYVGLYMDLNANCRGNILYHEF